MGNVVNFQDHRQVKEQQIREAERKAQEALHQAGLAYKELHRLKGD